MDEYIERKAAHDALADYAASLDFDECTRETIKNCLRALNRVPISDVAPVVHGRWLYDQENECYSCSVCGCSALNNYRGLSVDSKYCPSCGGKMDLEG